MGPVGSGRVTAERRLLCAPQVRGGGAIPATHRRYRRGGLEGAAPSPEAVPGRGLHPPRRGRPSVLSAAPSGACGGGWCRTKRGRGEAAPPTPRLPTTAARGGPAVTETRPPAGPAAAEGPRPCRALLPQPRAGEAAAVGNAQRWEAFRSDSAGVPREFD